MRLQGNKILITGATAGIGEALMFKFLKAGNQVIAVGRNERKLGELARSDKGIIPFACDITQEAALGGLIEFVKKKHPDTNILVNNAGEQYNYHFEQEPQLMAKIGKEIGTNLIAPLYLIALLLPTLQNNDNSAIINVSSSLGLVPKKQAPVYCGTKAGIHIFTKALRRQLGTVKVFDIIPPLVDTRMTAGRGMGKISPEKLADEFIKAFEKDRYEVYIGKAKLLRAIDRLSPALAERIMNK